MSVCVCVWLYGHVSLVTKNIHGVVARSFFLLFSLHKHYVVVLRHDMSEKFSYFLTIRPKTAHVYLPCCRHFIHIAVYRRADACVPTIKESGEYRLNFYECNGGGGGRELAVTLSCALND